MIPTGSNQLGKGFEVSRGSGYFKMANRTSDNNEYVPIILTQSVSSLAYSLYVVCNTGSDTDTTAGINTFAARNKAGNGSCGVT